MCHDKVTRKFLFLYTRKQKRRDMFERRAVFRMCSPARRTRLCSPARRLPEPPLRRGGCRSLLSGEAAAGASSPARRPPEPPRRRGGSVFSGEQAASSRRPENTCGEEAASSTRQPPAKTQAGSRSRRHVASPVPASRLDVGSGRAVTGRDWGRVAGQSARRRDSSATGPAGRASGLDRLDRLTG